MDDRVILALVFVALPFVFAGVGFLRAAFDGATSISEALPLMMVAFVIAACASAGGFVAVLMA